MNDDTKSLQNKIKLLVEENDLLKSELQELDEEVLSQRTKGTVCINRYYKIEGKKGYINVERIKDGMRYAFTKHFLSFS